MILEAFGFELVAKQACSWLWSRPVQSTEHRIDMFDMFVTALLSACFVRLAIFLGVAWTLGFGPRPLRSEMMGSLVPY